MSVGGAYGAPRHWLALLVVGAMFGVAAPASARIVADNGFRPPRDGFAFPNYGKSKNTNLTGNSVRALYGSSVCAFVEKSGKCVLTPPAKMWLEQSNRSMAGGHCEGFAVLSLLRFRKLFPALGSQRSYALRLAGNRNLQRAIAYAFMWQFLPDVTDGSVSGTPEHVLNTLISSLRQKGGESYAMSIFRPGFVGGHAITPFAVDDRGGGRFDVLVYDNNFPGKTRRLHVDTNKNTWSYLASTNPHDPTSRYAGDAGTKTLGLDPTSPGLGVHTCPFCGTQSAKADAYNELRLEGDPYHHAHLLITDDQGRRLGYADGKLVSEIPGGRAIQRASIVTWTQHQEPIYRLPVDANVKVEVNGDSLKTVDTEHLSIVGPNRDIAIDNIRIGPGQHNTFIASPTGHTLSYQSDVGQDQSPSMDVGLLGDQAHYRIVLTALSLDPGSQLVGHLDRQNGTLSFHGAGPNTQRFRATLTRYASKKVQQLQTLEVELSPNQQAVIPYATIKDGQKTLPLTVS